MFFIIFLSFQVESTDMNRTRICVIGAGVIGLATAVQILDKYGSHVHVTVMSEKFSPNTTSDGSAGFWEPYLVGDTPKESIKYILFLSFHSAWFHAMNFQLDFLKLYKHVPWTVLCHLCLFPL